ncbi:MAG: AAA family ATPase [Armatimonadetes bacterium]|nr:AAA family ATPase [Armatimonadota bacterium]
MYEQYWGLSEPPFSGTPDPRFLYLSQKHQDALTMLLYGVTGNKGAVMLTGEVGLGKTTLSRKLLSELDEENYKVIMIVHPVLTPVGLLREILQQLDVPEEEIPKQRQPLVRRLHEALLEYHHRQKRVVLVIDEAHLIRDRSTFEELRLLLNFQLNDRYLMTLLMLGQPELREKIERIPALKQRLAVRAHLPPLNLVETSEMIRYRLRAAWLDMAKGCPFTPEAIDELYTYTKGYPRVICQVADNALLMGMVKKTRRIDNFLMHSVIMALEGKDW